MIDYVNSRLVMWAEWVVRREEGALGYPKECPYTRLQQRSGGVGFRPNFASDALEIDAVMTKLKQQNPLKFRAVHLHYGVEFKRGKAVTVNVTGEQIAKDVGKCRDTVYNWIDCAHRFVLDALHERDLVEE